MTDQNSRDCRYGVASHLPYCLILNRPHCAINVGIGHFDWGRLAHGSAALYDRLRSRASSKTRQKSELHRTLASEDKPRRTA